MTKTIRTIALGIITLVALAIAPLVMAPATAQSPPPDLVPEAQAN